MLNECIRSINNTWEIYAYQQETYTSQLKEVLDQSTMGECQECIKSVIEARHKVLECQRAKFGQLYLQKWVAGQTQT